MSKVCKKRGLQMKISEVSKTVKSLIIKRFNKIKESNINILGFFLCPFILFFALEIIHLSYGWSIVDFLKNGHLFFKVSVSYTFLLSLFAGLLVIIPRVSVVNVIMCAVFYTMGLANDILCILTGDPLLPTDFLLLGSLGNIAGFVELPILRSHIFSFLICAASCVFFIILDRRKKKSGKRLSLKLPSRIAITAIGLVFFIFTTHLVCIDDDFRYNVMAENNVQIAAFNPKADYMSNGFILTFFPRIGNILMDKPNVYSKETMLSLKEEYTQKAVSSEVSSDKKIKPNIIAIQNEAWWDSSLIPNASFSKDPLKHTREIMKEGKGGLLVSPVYAGGTCMPEFEFLTGFTTRYLPAGVYPYIQSITSPTPSLASVCLENGYKTIAYHPYKENFYGRNKAYPLMGFEDFIGVDDLENPEYRGWYVSDMQLTNDIIKMYEEKEDKKLFVFGISMQNHGDYAKQRYDTYDIEVNSDVLAENDLQGLRDFTQGVYDSDIALKKLVDYFRNVSEPTLIVMYGDHLPLLGTDGSTYQDGGFVEKKSSFNYSEFEQLYKTPYVVWANYDISEYEFPSEISAGNLGVKIAQMAHLDSIPWYYTFLNEFYAKYPVYENSAIKNPAMETIKDIFEEDKPLQKKFELIEFDIINGKQYSK